MSKLELLITRCRNIWEELSVEPKIMDMMIDTFARPDFDLDDVTDESIKLSTQSFINNYMNDLNKEKEDKK